MNTKLNNWFIHPEYDNTIGVYCQFISFNSYWIIENINDDACINGLCGDVNTNVYATGYGVGNKFGEGSILVEQNLLSETKDILFEQEEDEYGEFSDYSENYAELPPHYRDEEIVYDGEGNGCGRGEYNGYCEN